MDRYKAALVGVVAVSLVVMGTLLALAPKQTPERKGPALIAVEIDFNGYGPGNTNATMIWSSGTNRTFDDWGTDSMFIREWQEEPTDSKIIQEMRNDSRDIVSYNYPHNDMVDWGIPVLLDNGTVYNALEKASIRANFTFKSEWYPNFRSHRVTEIAGVHDGTDNRFWQYYVNGVYMGTGADLTAVSDGDVVRWEFRSALQ
jgi:hypothetical protein